MSDEALLELLAWDTEFFGFRIGRLTTGQLDERVLESANRWCRANAVRCLYYLAEPADAPFAEGAGFLQVDTRLVYESATTTAPPDPLIRPHQPADVATLERIAASAHHDGRFYHDPGFGEELASRFYARWMAASCAGFADVVLVADAGDGATGYVTCRRDDGIGTIGLIGVAEAHRGRGLGARLVTAALDWFARASCSSARVVTQGRNKAGEALYERSGFTLRDRRPYFHYWPEPKIE